MGYEQIEARGGACSFLPAGKRGQIVFLVWVDLSEHKWIILAERRGRKLVGFLEGPRRMDRPLRINKVLGFSEIYELTPQRIDAPPFQLVFAVIELLDRRL